MTLINEQSLFLTFAVKITNFQVIQDVTFWQKRNTRLSNEIAYIYFPLVIVPCTKKEWKEDNPFFNTVSLTVVGLSRWSPPSSSQKASVGDLHRSNFNWMGNLQASKYCWNYSLQPLSPLAVWSENAGSLKAINSPMRGSSKPSLFFW